MQITSASKSSIESHDSCEWLYYLQYQIGIRSPSNKAALIGNICHTILEILAEQKRRGKHLLPLRRNDYLYLLDIVYKSYVNKNQDVDWNDKDKDTCRKHIEKVLASQFNPLNQHVIYTEQGFELEFNSKHFAYDFKDIRSDEHKSGYFKVRGFIDIITQEDKDTLHILDYKTGKNTNDWATGKTKEIEDFFKDLQLRIYYLAAKRLFPQYKKIKLTVYYIQLNKHFTVEMDGQDEIIIENLRRKFLQIRNNNSPRRLIDDRMRSKMHFKCHRFCYFGTTIDPETGKSLCQTYHDVYANHGFFTGSKELVKLTVDGKPASNNNLFGANIKRIRMFDDGDK